MASSNKKSDFWKKFCPRQRSCPRQVACSKNSQIFENKFCSRQRSCPGQVQVLPQAAKLPQTSGFKRKRRIYEKEFCPRQRSCSGQVACSEKVGFLRNKNYPQRRSCPRQVARSRESEQPLQPWARSALWGVQGAEPPGMQGGAGRRKAPASRHPNLSQTLYSNSRSTALAAAMLKLSFIRYSFLITILLMKRSQSLAKTRPKLGPNPGPGQRCPGAVT